MSKHINMKEKKRQHYFATPKRDELENNRGRYHLLALVKEPVTETGSEKVDWAYVLDSNSMVVNKIRVISWLGQSTEDYF